jgi:hypothetical protein
MTENQTGQSDAAVHPMHTFKRPCTTNAHLRHDEAPRPGAHYSVTNLFDWV